MKKIPYSCQTLSEDDISAVVEVLRSPFLTQGPKVKEFEDALCRSCAAHTAVAVSSGTAALHTAYASLGVARGDVVWTVPNTFVATSNAALYLGASVDFVDISREHANISVEALAAKLKHAEDEGRLPTFLTVVHFAGRVCDMAEIAKLRSKYGFRIIEDASHALGSFHHSGEPVGSSRYSEAVVFSFHPVKSIATGEGGAVLFRDSATYSRALSFRSHGITRESDLLQKKDRPSYYYEQQALGNNYRITDMQAALGISQLKKLPSFIEARIKIAKRYDSLLATLPLRLPPQDVSSAWHLYVIQIDETKTSRTRDELYLHLQERGIGANLHYLPVYLQPYYQQLGFRPGLCPESESYANTALSIPIYPTLENNQQDHVVEQLHAFFQS